MNYQSRGKIIQGIGGLYTICLASSTSSATPLDGMTVTSRARGVFRHEGMTPLPGDDVVVSYDDSTLKTDQDGRLVASDDGSGIRIEDILPRRCALIRPPMANLEVLFVSMAAAKPAPMLPTVDKLISIAEHNRIEPVIVIGKSDLDPVRAAELQALYAKAGFASFAVSCEKGEGIDAVEQYIRQNVKDKIAAFAGASGVGKSTLMNRLFPSLSRLTGEISQKNARGRHTTREVTLFALSDLWPDCQDARGYIADTPGFSLLDFTRFDFFEKDDLPTTMRDFAPYLGKCRWADCTHLKEEGCAVLEAVRRGDIASSRHESFVSIYNDLKDKHPWTKAPSHH
jgi:ribosome biogenesis GTPase